MSEVFVPIPDIVVEKPKKEKKKRVPMSEERKKVLREQLAHAREVKKAKKKEELALIAKHKDTPTATPAEPVKEIVEIPKEVSHEIVRPVKPLVIDTTHLGTPKTILDQLLDLKTEMAELKKGSSSKEDIAEIKELKAEMKELRDIAKQYKKQKSELKKKAKETPVKKEEIPIKPIIHIPKARYSTYKKSKWAALTNPLQ